MTAWEALLALWLSLPPSAPYEPPLPRWWAGGRLYTGAALHVGIRPAADALRDGAGVGFTVQVSWGAGTR